MVLNYILVGCPWVLSTDYNKSKMKVLTPILTNEICKIITLFFFKSVIPKERNAISYMFENTTVLKFCLY